MVDPFQEISFLTRSANRVTVLRTLAEGPHTERELAETTQMSETTVGRVLADFAQRGWIRETDAGHETTRLGTLLAEDYARLSASMDLACRLGPSRELLPLSEMDFDLRALTDARITDPDTHDALRSMDRWAELIQGADHIRMVANTTNKMIARIVRDELRAGMTLESVMTPDIVDRIRSRPAFSDLHREMLRAGATFYRAPEGTEFRWFLALYDDLVAIGGFDDDGTFRVGIESEAEPVRRWATETFESYRAAATELTESDLADTV